MRVAEAGRAPSDAPAGSIRHEDVAARYDGTVRRMSSVLIKRLAVLLLGVSGATFLACSCSVDAAVSVDRSGRLVRVDALRMQSTALDLAVALAVQGGELVLELHWGPLPAGSGSLL